jgi:hypothetical protein
MSRYLLFLFSLALARNILCNHIEKNSIQGVPNYISGTPTIRLNLEADPTFIPGEDVTVKREEDSIPKGDPMSTSVVDTDPVEETRDVGETDNAQETDFAGEPISLNESLPPPKTPIVPMPKSPITTTPPDPAAKTPLSNPTNLPDADQSSPTQTPMPENEEAAAGDLAPTVVQEDPEAEATTTMTQGPNFTGHLYTDPKTNDKYIDNYPYLPLSSLKNAELRQKLNFYSLEIGELLGLIVSL